MTGTLLYDRDCGFCQQSLRLLLRLGARCEHQTIQSADLSAWGISTTEALEAAWYVEEQRLFRGHEAVAKGLRSSRWLPVRLVGRVIGARALRPVMARAYAWVARNRHRLPGATCQL
ncbi:DCC1-like thiol-disulfide oxidoreductase family protein [Nocardioides sp. AE5]|uniref:thiol-disulfide oxidoreductase DCC family protein n=1 Tax=Nocardioides sp. AE5 TaxID=2962573 RepID=UPI002881B863|nr:DCC1-like thiol-disulfide oxidoreductase family protein [Nocardioides sp. AE5]MDT0203025.1 DCC1-like thiol-disulfide oxidoreductase family protein [Nocardioides sp. AE5]